MSTMAARTETERAAARVLLVEDNRDLLENLAEILAMEGYAVETAQSVREATAALARGPFDVALVDLNLSDGQGIDVVADIRRRAPETACVILTGNASLETAVDAVNRGAYAYLFKGGRIEDVLLTIARAAEKARLERALREERNFTRAIVSNAALGIAVVDGEGRIVEINPRMRELIGPGPEPRDAGDLIRLGADRAARERLAAALATGGAGTREVEVVRPDGVRRWWKISTSCIGTGDAPSAPAPGGREGPCAAGCAGTVAIVADVTDERELQRKVLESSRLAAIGEMAARVAHEIRNPLAGIAGAIRFLARGSDGDPKREEFSRELVALIGRLNAFVDDLLVYARPLRIAKEPVTLAALVDPLRRLFAEHPVVKTIEIETRDRLARPLQVDPYHFGMALRNLVINAAQAMRGRGHVWIEASPAPGPGRDALLVVSDDGPGIPREALATLFEAFSTTRVEGTGLGLSTTRRIVEAHGGTIEAQNREEGGARFTIRLPG